MMVTSEYAKMRIIEEVRITRRELRLYWKFEGSPSLRQSSKWLSAFKIIQSAENFVFECMSDGLFGEMSIRIVEDYCFTAKKVAQS